MKSTFTYDYIAKLPIIYQALIKELYSYMQKPTMGYCYAWHEIYPVEPYSETENTIGFRTSITGIKIHFIPKYADKKITNILNALHNKINIEYSIIIITSNKSKFKINDIILKAHLKSKLGHIDHWEKEAQYRTNLMDPKSINNIKNKTELIKYECYRNKKYVIPEL